MNVGAILAFMFMAVVAILVGVALSGEVHKTIARTLAENDFPSGIRLMLQLLDAVFAWISTLL